MLEYSDALQRKVRRDDVPELAISTWDLVSEAMKEGRIEQAQDLFEYTRAGSQRNSDSLVSFVEMAITRIAEFDEEEVMKTLRQRYFPRFKQWQSAVHGAKEALQWATEAQRGHHGIFTVTEEPDRYVVSYDPCGSGGRLRRTRAVGTTKKAYPWSWGKTGIPYYCCHCCIQWEIISTELQGYPVRITLIGDRPEDPCVHLFYKQPELIPEEYFARVGMKKDVTKIRERT